ncbi:MAG: histone deacetylase [Gammaproteobacteria bacterium]|nr:histone deacetylase [Gammaproteobacteria bacterium]
MFKACYSPRYIAATHTNSMEKLHSVAQAVVDQSLAELVEPDEIDPQVLRTLHDPSYVDAFLQGKMPLAGMSRFKWSEQLRDAVLLIQSGQLKAAEIALDEGICANIAQGFHHAVYECGGGFCTFNGLALVAQQYPEKKVFVLDCDQHGGNGTAEFTTRLPNLFNFTIFGLRYGCRDFERSMGRYISRYDGTFAKYEQTLHEAFEQILIQKTELLIYQAGMDCHYADPYGSSWFDSEAIYRRDCMVFEFAKKQGIPIMFVLAGGYQALPELVSLHVGTFRAASQFYSGARKVKLDDLSLQV